jgi:hypothetical protein
MSFAIVIAWRVLVQHRSSRIKTRQVKTRQGNDKSQRQDKAMIKFIVKAKDIGK